MDDNIIKGALDDFEADDFISAKEKLKGEISKSRDEFLKQKLGLEKDIVAKPAIPDEPVVDKEKITKKSTLTGK
jgi:hypothetical protein